MQLKNLLFVPGYLLFVIMLSSCSEKEVVWTHYKSPDNKFEISFPGEFEENRNTVYPNQERLDIKLLGYKDKAHFLMLNVMSAKSSFTDVMSESDLMNMIRSNNKFTSKGKILSEDRVFSGSNIGKQFVYELNNTSSKATIRYFIVDTDLYVITALPINKDARDDYFDNFLNSFKILT